MSVSLHGGAEELVAFPLEERIDDNAARDERPTVGVVGCLRIIESVTENGLVPAHAALDRSRVRVE